MPQVLVRLSKSLEEELDKLAKSLGVSRAEVVRMALREFIERKKKLKTRRMRGIVRSKLSLEDLERIYQVSR